VQAIEIPIGTHFGKLTVIRKAANTGKNRSFLVECTCGTIKVVQGRYLRLGLTTSCGCARAPRMTDGHKRSEHPLYQTWKSMHAKCTNRKHQNYASNGALGVRVCERWNTFEAFVEDMGARPKNTVLCRLHSMKDFTPENTKWLTPMQRRAQQLVTERDATACTV
jgi:hypothetical protein